jgi:hypothetical protein
MSVVSFKEHAAKRDKKAKIDAALEQEDARLKLHRIKNDARREVDEVIKRVVADLWKKGVGVVEANDAIYNHLSEISGLYHSEFRQHIVQHSEGIDKEDR